MHSPFFNFESHGCFPGVTSGVGKGVSGRSTLMPDEEDDASDYSSSSSRSSNSSNNE